MLDPNEPSHIPMECQVHSCHNEPIIFCYAMYGFVCDAHKKEFCDKDKHEVISIKEGLIYCKKECISQINQSYSYINRQKKNLLRYTDLLERLENGSA